MTRLASLGGSVENLDALPTGDQGGFGFDPHRVGNIPS